MDFGTRMYSQSILYFVLLTLEVPISKAEITVSNGTVESSSYEPCPESPQTCNPVWNYVSDWSIPFPCIYFLSADLYPREAGPESGISITILRRTKWRGDNRPYKSLGRCVHRKVGDLVGDLSVPDCRTPSSSLLQGRCSF